MPYAVEKNLFYSNNILTKSACPIDLKFSGKRHFHAKNIHLKFGCKRPSMLKVIAPYSTTVADPDHAFGGEVKLGGAKNVFICLNTKGCLRQKRGLSFLGQKVASSVGRTMLFFRE